MSDLKEVAFLKAAVGPRATDELVMSGGHVCQILLGGTEGGGDKRGESEGWRQRHIVQTRGD